MAPLLFLDFDGVLHPDPVYMRDGQPWLAPELGTLFEWAPILADILADFPDVQIVLSTSWVQHFGLRGATARLPASVASRVIDCVREKNDYIISGFTTKHWWSLTRYLQIWQFVRRKHVRHWIAIDDDDYGWHAARRHHLVCTRDDVGISDPAAQQDLREKLAALCREAAESREQTVEDQLASVFDTWSANHIQQKKLLGAELSEANTPSVERRAQQLILIADCLAELEKKNRHYSSSWLFNPNLQFGWKSPSDFCWEQGNAGVSRVLKYLQEQSQ